MKSLAETLLELRKEHGADSPDIRIWTDCDTAFYMGAAAMAQQFAGGQGTLALMVKELSIALARESQRLHERLRELENKVDPDPER